MTARSTYQTRSNNGANSVVASSTATFSLSTDDPLLSVTSAPTSVLMLRFGNTLAAPFAVVGPSAQPIPAPRQLTLPPAADRQDPPPVADQQQLQEPAPEPALAFVPAPAPAPEAEAKPTERSSGIELIIDSLTNHSLTEPISVSIMSLGDKVFTASARDLDIQATGNDIGEALIVLKQQIEEVYDTLNKRTRLDAEEKAKLQTLHTYIAPPEKKRWR